MNSNTGEGTQGGVDVKSNRRDDGGGERNKSLTREETTRKRRGQISNDRVDVFPIVCCV